MYAEYRNLAFMVSRVMLSDTLYCKVALCSDVRMSGIISSTLKLFGYAVSVYVVIMLNIRIANVIMLSAVILSIMLC